MTLIAAGVTAAWYERDVRNQDKLNQMVNTQPRIDASIELVRETTDDEYGSFFIEAGVGGGTVQVVNPPAFSGPRSSARCSRALVTRWVIG